MDEFKTNVNLAREYFDGENYSDALKTYLKALQSAREDSDRAVVWAELSWTFYQMDEYERTIEAIENTLKYDSHYAAREDLYRLQGYCYLGLMKDDLAMDYLKKSLQIDSHSEKQKIAKYELAKLYFKQKEYTPAKDLFDEIEDYFFENKNDYWFSILFFKGFILYYTKQNDESKSTFEKLLKNAADDPLKAAALFGLAFIAFDKKDYLTTINLCETITEKDPDFFDMETVGFLTASSFHYLGRNDVFEKYYTQLIMKYPKGRYRNELESLAKDKDVSTKKDK